MGPQFLAQRRHATITTIDPDGAPHAVPVWYVFRDSMIGIGTQSSSRKATNALARPPATVLVESREPGTERWISGADRSRSSAAMKRRPSSPLCMNDI